MRKIRAFKWIGIFLLLALGASAAALDSSVPPSCTVDRATGSTIDKKPFLPNAYGSRWNFATNRIVYMTPNAKGFYQIYTISPEGGTPRAVTGFQPELPADKHHGMPSWHPSGRYIVFEGQKRDWSGATLFSQKDYEALPGFGRHHDVWLIAADGSLAWQLTNDANTKQEGVLIPVFSPDGRHLAWTTRQPDGKTYVIKIADFAEKPEPHLENIRSYQPGGPSMYEPGSFTSDSRGLVYMGGNNKNGEHHRAWTPQIYLLDLASGTSKQLTHGDYYNEHPIVVKTPDGDWVVYMSDKGVDRYFGDFFFVGTDWYAMRIDGSGAKRLTSMNVKRKDNPENEGHKQVGCTVAPSPDGSVLLGDVQDSIVRQTGMVRVVHLTCSQ